MATELVKATLNSTWTDVAGAAASQLGVQWQNIGGLPVGLAFSTSAPGATDPYVTLAPSATFQDNTGSAHVWAICFGGTSTISATLNPASGGGGGGDATAANQTLQITQETLTNTRLGDTAAPAAGTVNSRLGVINTTLGTPFQAGGSIANTTFAATQATASNLNAQVVGNVANGAADSGNGVKVAGIYSASGTLSNMTVGNRTDMQTDISGNLRALIVGTSGAPVATGTTSIQVRNSTSNSNAAPAIGPLATLGYVWNLTNTFPQLGDGNGTVSQPFALAANRWSYAAAAGGITNTTTAVTFIAAAGVGIRNYLASIQIQAGALGAATEIAIRDGAGGTVLWRGFISTAGLVNGINIPFESPLKGTANTLMEVVTLTASITGAVYFNAQGFAGA